MTPMSISMAETGLDAQILKLQQAQAIVDRHMRTAMQRSVTLVEAGGKANAPVGVSGDLRRSIGSKVEMMGSTLTGRVGSSLNSVYPSVMEHGRKAGAAAPPASALERWVHLKLGVPMQDARGVAFVIARKIAAAGIAGKKFLTHALAAQRSAILASFKAAGDRVIKELKSRG